MFNGENVSPFYYVAVILYLLCRLRSDDQIDESFDALKRIFKQYISPDHPPPSVDAPGAHKKALINSKTFLS